MSLVRLAVAGAMVAVAVGCATVRQQDLDAWVGAPVAALDVHPVFNAIPMYRTIEPDGTEVRNYSNGSEVTQCFGSAGVRHGGHHADRDVFTSCSRSRVVCSNLFYIRDDRVLRYQPVGDCYTDDSVRPRR